MKKLILYAIALTPILASEGSGILETLRRAEAGAIKAMLDSGADPNQQNEIGATALMDAAAFSSAECVRVLLDRGAEVNTANALGATALMWATADAAKVRLLLDRGALVNAKTKDGVTALVTAARRGNLESVRTLLARGADPKAPELIRIAFATTNPALRDLLTDAGVKWRNPGDLGPIPGLGLNDPKRMREFLDLGGSPSQTQLLITGKVNLLALAAVTGELETASLLIQRGADPKSKNMHNWTALMMAATSSRPDVARFLIEKGADLHARDDEGRTALDWALTQGETEVARLLREAGAKPGVSRGPAPGPREKPRSARQAVQQAMTVLEPIGAIFHEKSGCVSCHNNSLPQAALNIALRRGIAVHPEAASHAAPATLGEFRSRVQDLMLSSCAGPAFLSLATKGLHAFRDQGITPGFMTYAVTSCLAGLQQSDGGWGNDGIGLRPPLSFTPIDATALAISALDRYSAPGLHDEMKVRIGRAMEFLRAAEPRDTQDEAFKLLGFIWAGAQPSEISRQADRLLALQRGDGGWGQLPKMAPDAYATGEALYALHASGLNPASQAYKEGAAYLLRTQLEDGSWHVRTRAFGFQPYQEYGFPHGKDQFISAAATAWAAIALSNTL
ncbi:MAG: ankyrin repeat domain-containing protein [Acidobacteriia bacterium]|nr:ankyrin repeat domain-containing protein [Terriglobia bacterium]